MSCKQCGMCCRWHVLFPWQFGDDLEWLAARGGHMSGTVALVPMRCPHLVNNQCDLQDKKPAYCRDWPFGPDDITIGLGCKFFAKETK